jgi:curved DNA-binding protein CbpA
VPEIQRVQALVGDLDSVLAQGEGGPAGAAEEIALNPKEAFLLSRIDGATSIRQICQVSQLGEDDTLRAILGLTSAGLVRLSAPGARPQPAAAAGGPTRRQDAMAKLASFLQRTQPATGRKESTKPSDSGPAVAPAPTATRKPSPAPAPTPVATRKPGPAPASAPTATGAGGDSAERSQLVARLRASESQNFYELLGVETNDTEDVIRQRYYSLARRFHPDRFHGPDVADLQPAMEILFARMNQAFHALQDPERRSEYDRNLFKGTTSQRQKQKAAAAEVGRENYRRGMELIGEEQFVKALAYLENAVSADPTRPEYFETLGMVQSLNPRLKEEAEATLKKGIELAPSRATGYLRLGLHYYKTRQLEKAAAALDKAVGWDPTDPVAKLALGKVKGGAQNALKDGTWLIKKILQEG